MSEPKFKYVYGLTKTSCLNGSKIKGINGMPVYEFKCRDIFVVMSDTDSLECDASEENLKTHQTVLAALIKRGTVVPMAFGTVFKNDEILVAILEKSYRVIKKSMELLEGKVELGVKVISPKTLGNPEMRQEFKNEIVGELGREAVNSVEGRLFSDRLLLNSNFLVEKGRLEKFSQAVEKIEKKHPEFKVHYTGPWPPYSFINIKIGE